MLYLQVIIISFIFVHTYDDNRIIEYWAIYTIGTILYYIPIIYLHLPIYTHSIVNIYSKLRIYTRA